MSSKELSQYFSSLNQRRKTRRGGPKGRPTPCRWCGVVLESKSKALRHQGSCSQAKGHGAGRRHINSDKSDRLAGDAEAKRRAS